MPIDKIKSPMLFPIWMGRAIETAAAHIGQPTLVLSLPSEKEIRSRMRKFRAYRKSLAQFPGFPITRLLEKHDVLVEKEQGGREYWHIYVTLVPKREPGFRVDIAEALAGAKPIAEFGK